MTPNVEILASCKYLPSQSNSRRHLKWKHYCARIRTRTKCPSLAKVVSQFWCPSPNFSKGLECTALFFRHYYLLMLPINIIIYKCFCIFPCNGNLWVSQRSSPEIIDRRHSEIVKQTTEMSVRASGHYVLPFLTILEANLLNIKEQVTSFCLKDLRKLVSQCESLRA